MTNLYSKIRRGLATLPDFVSDLTFARTKDGVLQRSSAGLVGVPKARTGGNALVEVEPQDALLVTARYADSWGLRYALLLDIDHLDVKLVPSSRNGKDGRKHHHLYIGARMTKGEHDRVMEALMGAGIVEAGFAKAAMADDFGAALRLPWVKKGEDLSLVDAVAAAEAVPF